MPILVEAAETVRNFIPELWAIPVFRRPYLLPRFQVQGLTGLDNEGYRLLVEQVYRAGRTANILVHPYYREGDTEDLYPITDYYRADRDSLIRTSLQEGVPLVVFERKSQCGLLANRIQRDQGILFTATTIDQDATPVKIQSYTNNYPFWSPRELARFRLLAWYSVTEVLKNVGVKHVAVGGRYLWLHKVTNERGQRKLDELTIAADRKPHARKWLRSGLIPSGCVGQVVYELLESGFDVSLSPISSPSSTLEPTDFSNDPRLRDYY